MSEMSQRTIDTVQRWLNDPYVDEETKQELRSLEHDTKELEERFYRDLNLARAVCAVLSVQAATGLINIR